jgi:hypothetical protein
MRPALCVSISAQCTDVFRLEYNFAPNVKSIVHMTVKPQEIVDEEEANKRLKEPGSQSGRSGCCVIL